VTLAWNPSPDDVTSNGFLGYLVYRSNSLTGTFSKVSSLVTATMNGNPYSFTDTTPDGNYVYMVRAIRTTQLGTSSSYENASTGVFATRVVLQGRTSTSVGDDVYLKRFTGTSEDSIRVWANVSRAGEPNYKLDARTTTSIEFDGNAGDDLLTLDHASGSRRRRVR
jgi:hypothetical protein